MLLTGPQIYFQRKAIMWNQMEKEAPEEVLKCIIVLISLEIFMKIVCMKNTDELLPPKKCLSFNWDLRLYTFLPFPLN